MTTFIENYIEKQWSASTAEDEVNYIAKPSEAPIHPNPNTILPPGTYRVIDGQLYRIVGGTPPTRPLQGSVSPKIGR